MDTTISRIKAQVTVPRSPVSRITRHSSRITLLCLSGVVVLSAIAAFADTENPYQNIVDRNVFGLRPPPPPPSTEPPKPPIPPINLTGITTILGKKMAFMTIQLPPKAGEPAKAGPTSFMLCEGERDGDIEVVSIDEKAGSVKVSEFGTITNVTFGKLPATPAPTAAVAAGAPGGLPPINNPGIGSPRSIPGLPTRTLRLGNNQGGAMNPNPSANGYSSVSPQATGVPSSGLTTISGLPIEAPRSPEETVALYEANRLKNEEAVRAGKLPPMPSHILLRPPQGQGQQQPQ